MMDSRTVIFTRGTCVWPLNVEFEAFRADPDSGTTSERCIWKVEYWNRNKRVWQRFALTAEEFADLDERINSDAY